MRLFILGLSIVLALPIVGQEEIGTARQEESVTNDTGEIGTEASASVALTAAAEARRATSEATIAAESARLAAEEARNWSSEQQEAVDQLRTWWEKLDDSLDASLSATLAGLALAALAFIASLTQGIRLTWSTNIDAGVRLANKATELTMKAYWGFLAALVGNLTIDPAEVEGTDWTAPTIADIGLVLSDTAVTGGGLVVGMVYLTRSAQTFMRLSGIKVQAKAKAADLEHQSKVQDAIADEEAL